MSETRMTEPLRDDAKERAEAHQADLALVEAVLRRDPKALDVLIERLSCVPRILHTLNERAGRVLSAADLSDLSQDVLILIWEKLKTFEGRATLETWTYRFCWLESRNRFRRVYRGKEKATGSSDTFLEEVPAPEVAPLAEHEAIEIGLRELGPPGSEVIRLKHFEERTFPEIGDLLGIPTNTAKTHYYRGLEWLRQRLRSLGEGLE